MASGVAIKLKIPRQHLFPDYKRTNQRWTFMWVVIRTKTRPHPLAQESNRSDHRPPNPYLLGYFLG